MTAVLEVDSIFKSFSGNEVLKDVSFSASAGRVHALVGENGAGKSTLMNIIGGIHKADSGTILLGGESVRFTNPWQAKQNGISIVHQELSLAPNMTVAQNIFVRREKSNRLGFIDWNRLHKETAALFDRIGVDISPTEQVGRYSVAMQQLIEIAKAISFNAKIIIMDEPTSALSQTEVERLFKIINELKTQGVAVVFISHKLSEVFRIADEISVLRDGLMVGHRQPQATTQQEIIQLMVGRAIEDMYPPKADTLGDIILEVQDLGRSPAFEGISFSLRKGEILGFAGLVGAGRTEVARAIFGADPTTTGRILLNGEPLSIQSPRDAIDSGIVYLSEDRKTMGLFLPMSVRENIVAASLNQFTMRLGFLNHREIAERSRDYVELMGIRPQNDRARILSLSGGNQQKTLLAKWLSSHPKVLIADEPTRGVDVGAKAKIHQDLRELANNGVGVIMISSELPEVLGLSDRVAVFREGRLATILENGDLSQEVVMKYAIK